MRTVAWLAFVLTCCAVAVCLSVGVTREHRHTWQPPTVPPTQTPAVEIVERLIWVEITQTPAPTPYTEATYRRAQRAGIVPTAVVRPTMTPHRGTDGTQPLDMLPDWSGDREDVGG